MERIPDDMYRCTMSYALPYNILRYFKAGVRRLMQTHLLGTQYQYKNKPIAIVRRSTMREIWFRVKPPTHTNDNYKYHIQNVEKDKYGGQPTGGKVLFDESNAEFYFRAMDNMFQYMEREHRSRQRYSDLDAETVIEVNDDE